MKFGAGIDMLAVNYAVVIGYTATIVASSVLFAANIALFTILAVDIFKPATLIVLSVANTLTIPFDILSSLTIIFVIPIKLITVYLFNIV